jgi:CHAT domain-containing protein
MLQKIGKYYYSFVLFILSLICTYSLSFFLAPLVKSQNISPSDLVREGVVLYQKGDYLEAIAKWKSALVEYEGNNNFNRTPIIWENLARGYQQVGDDELAILAWEKVINFARERNNLTKLAIGLNQQAQIYISNGKNNNAFTILCGSFDSQSFTCSANSVLEIFRREKNQLGEVATLGSLAEIARLQGKYDRAIALLEKAHSLAVTDYEFALLNSLGNAYLGRANLNFNRGNATSIVNLQKGKQLLERAILDRENASKNFNQALQVAEIKENLQGQLTALLNLIKLNNEQSDRLDRAYTLVAQLPNSHFTAISAIELARLSVSNGQKNNSFARCLEKKYSSEKRALELLNLALNIAQKIDDRRSESFALGTLGHFYECDRTFDRALELTQQALLIADVNLSDRDSLYLWEWQLGRIFQAQSELLLANREEKAAKIKEIASVAAFERAFNLLEKIRTNLLITEQDFQLDFREAIEPIYRQLASLKIKLASAETKDIEKRDRDLSEALTTIDALRLAELQNYLGTNCFNEPTRSPRSELVINNNTAVISSLILEDSIAILIDLPQQKHYLHQIIDNRQEVLETIEKLPQKIVKDRLYLDSYDRSDYLKLYNWLFKPLEQYLIRENIETLVFVQDGIFRTIPMAALYDGQKFLIEKYAIAITPSTSLISTQKTIDRQQKALILGVSEASEIENINFNKLLNVPTEIETIEKQFPNNTVLQDKNLSKTNLQKQIKTSPYPIIHIASHANFGVIPEDTFIVLGNNEKLTIAELETALRNIDGGAQRIQLLTISACQTAVGNDRSALGLAGVAIQTGVKSVLASLWTVNDGSTLNTIKEFYTNLIDRGTNKAEALRQAQLKLIHTKQEEDIDDRYDNPYYWAAFVLIGN